MGRCDSTPSATSLVRMSRVTMPSTVPQNRRRLAALSILFLRLALNAQAGVRQRVESIEADFLAALLALPELVRILVQAPQRLVHVPQVAALLRSEQERLFALHRIGALVRHVERIARE